MLKNKFENGEILPKVGVYDLESFKKEILIEENPYSLELKDKRFIPLEEGGVFKYFNYRDDLAENKNYSTGEILKKVFPYLKINNKIVALAKLSKAPFEYYKENTFYISFVSVDKAFQGKGYATQLLEEIFLFAKQHNIQLKNSSYSTEGDEKLYYVVQRLREKYPEVDFQEDEIYLKRREKLKRRKKKK